jgi:hypothetical protein
MAAWLTYRQPLPGTRYPDWAHDTLALRTEARRLRTWRTLAFIGASCLPALLGAGCGLATGVALSVFKLQPVLDIAWWPLALGGAAWGALAVWPLTLRALAGCRAHIQAVLGPQRLAAWLGPDVRLRFPLLIYRRGGKSSPGCWVTADGETVSMRVWACRDHYDRLARESGLAARPSGIDVTATWCLLLPVLIFLAAWAGAYLNPQWPPLPAQALPAAAACCFVLTTAC